MITNYNDECKLLRHEVLRWYENKKKCFGYCSVCYQKYGTFIGYETEEEAIKHKEWHKQRDRAELKILIPGIVLSLVIFSPFIAFVGKLLWLSITTP
jgi:hypothetical protein